MILPVSIHIAPALSKETTDCLDGAIIKDFGHKVMHSGKCAVSCKSKTCYRGDAAAISYLGEVTFCYDRLSPWDLFSTLLLLPSYASVRTMSIPGGPVCILPWSPELLSRALSSGRPYPCSPPPLLVLNGVGSHFLISLLLALLPCDPRGQYYLL